MLIQHSHQKIPTILDFDLYIIVTVMSHLQRPGFHNMVRMHDLEDCLAAWFVPQVSCRACLHRRFAKQLHAIGCRAASTRLDMSVVLLRCRHTRGQAYYSALLQCCIVHWPCSIRYQLVQVSAVSLLSRSAKVQTFFALCTCDSQPLNTTANRCAHASTLGAPIYATPGVAP